MAKINEEKGVMANVAASANDPIFLSHHAMVDCIFEEWLQQKKRTTGSLANMYPTDVGSDQPKHHRPDEYIVLFFPLATHRYFFDTADKFGYECSLDPANPVGPRPNSGGGTTSGGADVLVPLNWAMLTSAIGVLVFLISA